MSEDGGGRTPTGWRSLRGINGVEKNQERGGPHSPGVGLTVSNRGEWSDKRRTKISLLGLTRRCWNSSYAETAEAWGTRTPSAGESWKTFGGEEKNTARGRDSRRK